MDAAVAKQIGNNIREKRNRLVKKMKEIKKKNLVVRPFGCSEISFDAIFKIAIKEGPKKLKSDRCKAVAKVLLEERGHHHRFGAGGI